MEWNELGVCAPVRVRVSFKGVQSRWELDIVLTSGKGGGRDSVFLFVLYHQHGFREGLRFGG